MARIAAAARILASLLVTATIAGGIPTALVMWAGWPVPHRWPTADQWVTFADQPLTHLPIKTVAAVTGWLLWLLLVLSLGLEAWIRFARRPPPVILPRPMRVLAAGMLGTSVVAVATSAHASPPVATPANVHHAPIHQNPFIGTASTQGTDLLVPANPTETDDPPGAQDKSAAEESSRANIYQQGIDVPGGWIVWPVAAGVITATAITLLRFRTLPPASALLYAIRRAQHGAADPTGEEPPTTTDDSIAVLEQDATSALPLKIGLRGTTGLGIDSLPRGGVAITGPGSTDALRGILAAVATSTNATIVIPADLLHALTGGHLSLPGVIATHDAHTAMHSIQMEIHRCYTLTAEPTHSATENAHPPRLLLIEPTVQPRRLAALAELGSDLNIRVVVAGPSSVGDSWSVDSHGHTTAGPATIGRINMLNPEGLAQLAHALREPAEVAAGSAEVAPPDPQVSAIFHLFILGPPRLATSSSPAIHIRRSGFRQIAVYLALHPDGASRDELLEQIFGHMTMASATTSLNSCLYELRRLLTANGASALTRLDDTYRLDPQLITVDWWQLLYHLRSGDLTQATAQYTGHLADGYTWPWLPEHRQHTRHLIADAHASLARTATTPDQALTHALAGITIDPNSTASHHAAIDAYTHLGQSEHAQALREELAKRLTRLQRVERQRMSA